MISDSAPVLVTFSGPQFFSQFFEGAYRVPKALLDGWAILDRIYQALRARSRRCAEGCCNFSWGQILRLGCLCSAGDAISAIAPSLSVKTWGTLTKRVKALFGKKAALARWGSWSTPCEEREGCGISWKRQLTSLDNPCLSQKAPQQSAEGPSFYLIL